MREDVARMRDRARRGEVMPSAADLRLRNQLHRGLGHLKAGELDAARATFSEILATNPKSSSAYLGLGRVYFQERNMQEALHCFQEALARSNRVEKTSVAKFFIARCREELGDVDAAMEEYEEASVLNLNPSAGFAQMRMSRFFAQQGDLGEAVGRLRAALQNNPQQLATRFMLANLLEKSGEVAAAKSELQRILDQKPDAGIAAYRLGRLHLRDGEMSVARTVLERAVRLSPDNGAPRLALGAALKGLGEYAEALAVLKDAQQLSSNPSPAAVMIAECHIKLDQPEEALEIIPAGLALEPTTARDSQADWRFIDDARQIRGGNRRVSGGRSQPPRSWREAGRIDNADRKSAETGRKSRAAGEANSEHVGVDRCGEASRQARSVTGQARSVTGIGRRSRRSTQFGAQGRCWAVQGSAPAAISRAIILRLPRHV